MQNHTYLASFYLRMGFYLFKFYGSSHYFACSVPSNFNTIITKRNFETVTVRYSSDVAHLRALLSLESQQFSEEQRLSPLELGVIKKKETR